MSKIVHLDQLSMECKHKILLKILSKKNAKSWDIIK